MVQDRTRLAENVDVSASPKLMRNQCNQYRSMTLCKPWNLENLDEMEYDHLLGWKGALDLAENG